MLFTETNMGWRSYAEESEAVSCVLVKVRYVPLKRKLAFSRAFQC